MRPVAVHRPDACTPSGGRLPRRPRPGPRSPRSWEPGRAATRPDFFGTRDTGPGCGSRWSAGPTRPAGRTYLEEPDLIHVFPILPFVPQARRAWRGQTMGFSKTGSLTRISACRSTTSTAPGVRLWKLRQDVFVVEQEAAYPDLDGSRPGTEQPPVLLTDEDEGTAAPATPGPRRPGPVADRSGRRHPPLVGGGWPTSWCIGHPPLPGP